MFKLNVLLLVLVFGSFSEVLCLNEAFQRASILYGISVEAAYQVKNNGSQNACYKQLTEFCESADKNHVWTLKMMDVSGRPNQGFIGGNNGWTGQSTICADITNREPVEVHHEKVVQLVTDYDFPPYELGFVSAFMRHDNELQMKTNTPLQNLIQLGLCTPGTCEVEDIQPLLESFLKKKLLTFQNLFDVNFKIESMKKVQTNGAWLFENTRNRIIITTIFGLFGLIALISFYDIHIYSVKQNKKMNEETEKEESENKEKSSNEGDNAETETDVIDEIKNEPNILNKIALCFSWNRTYRMLLRTEVPDEIGALNGSMFFAILFMAVYTYLQYTYLYFKHLPMEFRKFETFIGQIVTNSSFSVDSFLFLSGCLVAYNFYKTRSEIVANSSFFTKIAEFCILVIGKIFRCLPLYAIWIMLTIYTFSYLDAVWPAILTENPHVTCPQTWWRNLLFINNLYPISGNETCMSWTWLLAADMQYYIISVFLLILSTISLNLSVGIIISMIVYGIYSNALAAYGINYIHTIDQQLAQYDEIYHLPWHRFGPYGVGILTGIFLYKIKGKLPLKNNMIWLCWTIAPLISFYLIFGLTGIKPSVIFSSLFISLGRTAWALSLAWILIACVTGYGGYLNSILSYPGFHMFHKLSYSTYIFMIFCTIFVNITFEATVYFSNLAAISQILTIALTPYLLNTALTLFIEIPFELLWKTFVRS